MSKIMHGKIHGRTIELSEESGLAEGQDVEVSVRVTLKKSEPWGEGLKRCAGALADDPHWDAIMEEIHQERRHDSRREVDFE